MTDMQPTMQLRWSYERTSKQLGWPVLLPVLQQLWQETTRWYDRNAQIYHVNVVAEEWRDVPVVGE